MDNEQAHCEVDTYPTMRGISAKYPFIIEIDGYSVKSWLSITGRKVEYGPVLSSHVLVSSLPVIVWVVVLTSCT